MATTQPKKSGINGLLPWLKPALQSRRTIKTWLRCCIALAVALILMVATKPSNTMGQAAFFCVIVAVMLPPTMALSVFIMAATTLLLGMLLGWAWGSAAMASALSVRSSALLAAQQQQVQSSINPNSPIPATLQVQLQTFHGAFLDPRSSAVYGAFLFLGAFGLATLRAFLPNLALLSIFGTIVLDVMCTTGPLVPRAQYIIAESFLLPATFYVAVAIGTLMVIFPESLSHVWLTSLMDTFWTPTLELFRLQNEALDSKPSDKETWAERNARGNELRSMLVNATEAITAQIKLIDMDWSLGRLGPSDLKKFNAELKSIMFRVVGLHSFNSIVTDANVTQDKALKETNKLDRFHALQRKMMERESQHGHDLDSLVPILASSSLDLRNASESAIVTVMDWMQEFNSRRWANLFRPDTEEQILARHNKLVAEVSRLQAVLEEFRTTQRVELIRPYQKFFDPVTKRLLKDVESFASRSLYICFVFIDTLDAFAECMVKLLKLIIEIDGQRKKAKFWFPGRISRVKENIINGDFKGTAGPFSMGTAEDPASFDRVENQVDSSASTLGGEDEEDEDLVEKERTAEPPKRRNPDAFPPTTMFGKTVLKVAPFFRFFKSTEGIFALRMGIVSVALWIPSVCRSSAWFYYSNRGLWALIMSQTGLALYAGDQIAGFIVRLAGTLIGLLFGMVVWYIGAGLGHGNPYGIVIASTIAISPFIFMRVAGPPQQMPFWMMIGVTIVFVVGYSWINANQAVLSNAGVGVALGWKRALLVIIGFTAAFIVMLFPNPISSRVLVRKTLAAVLGESGNIFAGEVEAFLAEEQRARNGFYEKVEFTKGNDDLKASPKEKRTRKIGRRVVAVSTRMRDLYPSLTTAKFEPQFSGTWPHEEYQELFRIQQRILGSLALLITSFTKLDTKWCSALVHRTPFMNPNFLADVFATVAILSNCLMQGHPLPAYLPKLRDRLLYHEYHAGRRTTPSFPNVRSMSGAAPAEKSLDTDSNSDLAQSSTKDKVADDELTRDAGPVHVDGSPMGIEVEELTLDLLLDEQLPAHSTAIVALSSLISRVDETIDLVRNLCGEATFRGYELLQQDYLDREERAIGGSGGVRRF
ncbi:hypothetical protein CPC08DRAFT_708223 [Agrocybe pediades]|nr:hypothetical protein CPC08DRAFT_708223 [Agrocybe pediades]